MYITHVKKAAVKATICTQGGVLLKRVHMRCQRKKDNRAKAQISNVLEFDNVPMFSTVQYKNPRAVTMSFVHKLYLLIFKQAEIVRLEGSKTKRGREDRERSQQILRLLMHFFTERIFYFSWNSLWSRILLWITICSIHIRKKVYVIAITTWNEAKRKWITEDKGGGGIRKVAEVYFS